MEVDYTPSIEKQYHKKHEEYKAKWFVTPAKLIYPGQPMIQLYTPIEYIEACCKLSNIIEGIKADTGVDLLHEAKLHRVDVSKDIETPSEEYSQEVIRIAKKALYKYGYNLWTPTEDDVRKNGWQEENSVMFCNHNQDVKSKIYNKMEDIKKLGYDTENLTGLLRFELALKWKFMKLQGYIREEFLTTDALADTLVSILNQAPDLLQKHIVSHLWSGAMLSKDLQKKYIRKKCGTKEAKYKKMIAYRKKCNRNGVYHDSKVEKYFEEMELPPLYTDKVKYIPSFADLLAGKTDYKKSIP